MFPNYFKTALRSLLKNKIITLINIFGLSIGISSALIIFLMVQYDLSFDRYEPDRGRIYRVVSQGENWNNRGVPAPMHVSLQQEVPGIEQMAAFFDYNDNDIKVSVPRGNDQAPRVFPKSEKIVFADKQYFDLFPHEWLAGNAAGALKAPYQVVLSEGLARLYFPGLALSDVIGRTVIYSDSVSTTVSGVVKDLKASTDFDNLAFISLSTIPSSGLKANYNWGEWESTSSVSQVVIKLGPGVSAKGVEQQIAAYADKRFTAASISFRSQFHLQPLDDIHFNGNYDGTVSKSTLLNLGLLACFLLLLGAINFINLSTAQSSERAKEIGVRKTLGSSKWQLVFQFLNETFLLTILATVISVLIMPALLKIFSGFIPDGLTFTEVFQPQILLFLAGLVVMVSGLAGIYPALVMTRFQPIMVLKKQVMQTGQTRGVWLRKVLTVSQFAIAQVLIIGTLIVNKQINYSLQKDMGFRKQAIVNFYVPFDFQKEDGKKFVLLNQLRTIPEIELASLGNQAPAFSGFNTTVLQFKDGKKELKILPDSRCGDPSYIDLYHIKLLAGRNVLRSDSATELLINATMARQMGFQRPGDAVGKILEWDSKRVTVAGVMSDFNLASVRTSIHPAIFYSDLRYGYVMHVGLRSDAATWPTALSKMKAAWKAVYPDKELDYSFLDANIERLYTQDRGLSKLLSWSAGIAIFIGCLGLLGLVIFTSNRRAKEIGIRKILGATVSQIISLLSRDLIGLVGLGFLIAVPIGWWVMYRWLQDFAYHTTLSWWTFLLSGAAMLAVALVILCIRAGRAAVANPVDSLRNE